ncbi:MAG: ABC transporter ATP-binding protein [candidate division WOR-3 bacterium]
MNSTILQAVNISKTFVSGNEKLEVLKDISLEVQVGEWLCILGPSGSGKSTLLHILGGLDRPDSGIVKINNVLISNLEPDKICEVRNRSIGFVFQFHHLLPEFNVIENVALPLLIRGVPKDSAFRHAEKILSDLDFNNRTQASITELSGGERQKVALARALVIDPLIILADEPTGNLDVTNTEMLLGLFKKINQEKQVTIITVTHNQNLVAFAHRKLFLKNGKLFS